MGPITSDGHIRDARGMSASPPTASIFGAAAKRRGFMHRSKRGAMFIRSPRRRVREEVTALPPDLMLRRREAPSRSMGPPPSFETLASLAPQDEDGASAADRFSSQAYHRWNGGAEHVGSSAIDHQLVFR